ncbi:hypothetical protein D3C75_796860 [compost metagenome]
MLSAWLLRPIPHFNNQMKYFLEHNIVAVGYPVGEELSKYNYDQLRDILAANLMEGGVGNVFRLVHQMNPGDLVVVPDENSRDVYFARITGEYKYVPELDVPNIQEAKGFPHQRDVEWFFDKKPLLRSDLPEALLKSLRFPGAVAELTKHLPLIAEIIGDTDLIEAELVVNTEFKDLYVKALNVLEDALNSEDMSISLQAVELVLRYSKS